MPWEEVGLVRLCVCTADQLGRYLRYRLQLCMLCHKVLQVQRASMLCRARFGEGPDACGAGKCHLSMSCVQPMHSTLHVKLHATLQGGRAGH